MRTTGERSTRRSAVAMALLGSMMIGCSASSDGPSATARDANDVAATTDDSNTDGSTIDGSTTDDATTDDATDSVTDLPDTAIVSADASHADVVAALAGLLPGDTRGVFAVDLAAMSDESSVDLATLVHDDDIDPVLAEILGPIGSLAGAVDVASMTTALLAQTTDATDGLFLLARVRGESIDDVLAAPTAPTIPTADGTYGPSSHPLYVDTNGNHLTLLPGGVLVVGKQSVVESVLDVVDGASPADESAIVSFLESMTGGHVDVVYGLPALFDDITLDRTLRGAAVMSGSLDIGGGNIDGEFTFHTSNAAEFVEAYNALDRHAQQAERPSAQPLTLADPVVGDLGRVVATVLPTPLRPSPEELVASRNTAKKLFVGMDAHDYSEDVFNPGNAAWYNFLVKSELDDTPPSPGSVYIRWEFRDQAAVEAFEANELPAGFTIAPTRFLESDPPEGRYFLALNLYNGGGGMIVGGRGPNGTSSSIRPTGPTLTPAPDPGSWSSTWRPSRCRPTRATC